MPQISSNLQCPSCSQALRPKLLVCDSCDIKVEGPFHLNEFATLSADDLHFLRIFVHSEGRIKDMESALGLSYPTIRARLTALKNRLSGEVPSKKENPSSNKDSQESATAKVLGQLEAGEISFEEAMAKLKQIRKR